MGVSPRRARALHLQLPPSSALRGRPGGDRRFERAVRAEIERRGEDPTGRSTRVVAFSVGGGDPLTVGRERLDRILPLPAASFSFRENGELSIEASPARTDAESLRFFRGHRFNRISFRAGDGSSPAELARAVGGARREGFRAVAADVPLDVGDRAERIGAAIRAGADHVSLVEVEAGSLSGAAWIDRYRDCVDRLEGKGLRRYELFHFARPRFEATSIRIVSAGGDVIGVGPGGAGMIGRLRYRNPEGPEEYAAWVEGGMDGGKEERLADDELARERILLGLRRGGGFDPRREGARSGIDLEEALAPAIGRLEGEGLLRRVDRRISLTERGIPLADSVTLSLFGPWGLP